MVVELKRAGRCFLQAPREKESRRHGFIYSTCTCPWIECAGLFWNFPYGFKEPETTSLTIHRQDETIAPLSQRPLARRSFQAKKNHQQHRTVPYSYVILYTS